MRIVILSDRLPPEYSGGAEKVAWRLAQGLRDAGHHVEAITASHGPPRTEQRDGMCVHVLQSKPPGRLQSWRTLYHPGIVPRLHRLLHELAPDVVNAHNIQNYLSYAALPAARAAGAKVVFTAHDAMPFAYAKLTHHVSARFDAEHLPTAADYRLPPGYNLRQMRWRYNPFRNLLIRRLLDRFTDARVCVSEAHRLALEGNGLPHFRVVYSGVDCAAFQAAPENARRLKQRLGLAGRPVALFGGRVGSEKGAGPLFVALREVIKRVPDAALLILSSARPAPATIPDDLKSHVTWGGWLSGDDLAAAYALARVTLVPSMCFESAGMMALESMAAGTPVIGSPFGALPELIAHNETGYIVNPLDIRAFAGALGHLLEDAQAARDMGVAGAARVRARFSLAGQVQAMEQLFAGTLNVKAPEPQGEAP